jgi:hypothetical protein
VYGGSDVSHLATCFGGEMKRTRSDETANSDLPSSRHPNPPSVNNSSSHPNGMTSKENSHSNGATTAPQRKKCPYLDTVDRQHLDFDMEKVCSVTLSNMNIYACLVCGHFFQGRGQSTPGNSSLLPLY